MELKHRMFVCCDDAVSKCKARAEACRQPRENPPSASKCDSEHSYCCTRQMNRMRLKRQHSNQLNSPGVCSLCVTQLVQSMCLFVGRHHPFVTVVALVT
jgi:hypothetical protein